MTNKNIRLLIFGFLFLPAACSKSDPFKGNIELFPPPGFSENTALDSKMKEMYDRYNVLFRTEFTKADLNWNWAKPKVFVNNPGIPGSSYYTVADKNYAIEVIDSVESWIFKTFPPEFSKKYMPLNIFLVDTLLEVSIQLTDQGNYFAQMSEGEITTNYTLVPYVSSRFDDEKNKRMLRDSWLSLFVEKLYPQIPYPKQFAAISTKAYEIFYRSTEDVMAKYAILKPGRKKRVYPETYSPWYPTTLAQDFGDFVAFIVFTPEEEKQLAYSKNANILTKVNLVKSHFKTHFNIELPYKPMKP